MSVSTIKISPLTGRFSFQNSNSEIDPYLIIRYADQVFISSISKHCDTKTNPKWSDSFELINTIDSNIVVECWDYNPNDIEERREIIGSSEIPINDLINADKKVCRIHLFKNSNDPIAELCFEIEAIYIKESNSSKEIDDENEKYVIENPLLTIKRKLNFASQPQIVPFYGHNEISNITPIRMAQPNYVYNNVQRNFVPPMIKQVSFRKY